MTEQEFQLLDELYFVISFAELEDSAGMERRELLQTLESLWERGWLRCYNGVDNELDPGQADIKNLFDKYHYLASKAGLMAHNSR